jgi:hypothetical protein
MEIRFPLVSGFSLNTAIPIAEPPNNSGATTSPIRNAFVRTDAR